MKEPELVTATQQELDEILALAKTSFPRKHYELLQGVLGTFVFVMLKLQNAKTSIKRKRSANPSFPVALKLRVSCLGNRRAR